MSDDNRQYPAERRRWDDTDGNLRLSVPVREYIDREIKREIQHEREMAAERQRFSDHQFVTIEEARRIAKVEQDRRLEGMNEFREQLNRQAATFVTHDILHSELKIVNEKIAPLCKAADRSEGSSSVTHWLAPSAPSLIALGISAVALVLALIR